MRKLQLITFATILLAMYSVSGVCEIQTKTWLRIEQPGQNLLSKMSSKSLNYGSFIWVEKSISEPLLSTDYSKVTEYIDPFYFRLDTVSFDPLQSIPSDALWFNDIATNINGFFIVQFNGPIKPEWLINLQDLNIKPLKALAPFSYIVWTNSQALENIKPLSFVRWNGYFYSAFRVQGNNRHLPSVQTQSMALVYKKELQETTTKMKNIGATVLKVRNVDVNFDVITFKVAGNLYSELSKIAGILTVQKISQDAGARGEMSQQSIVGNYDGSNAIFPGYQDWLTPTGLDGTGIKVGVVDGGIFENHPDLTDNMSACIGLGPSCGSSTSSHGTHVAGAIGGSAASGVVDSNGFLRGQGVAPGVSIVEQLYSPLLGAGPGGMVAGGMLSIFKDSAVSGVQLTNNSWGPTGTPQGYDIPTMEIDMISRDADPDTVGSQPILAVWSIMNGGGDGGGSCNPSSLGSPDEAKNLFAVGSTKLQISGGSQIPEIFDISSNSAHGPACDGRLIPHIVAPGCSTDAPNSSTGYGFLCGTSMASPVISGSVALFWQWYRNTFSVDPSPALVKATFTAVAKDLNGFQDADGLIMGHPPDRKQGWGRVDLDKVINPVNQVRFYDQQTIFTATGETWNQELVADDPSKELRVMLVWTDAPGAGLGGTTPAWVNDLDLTVITSSASYRGNVFGTDGFSTTGGTVDEKNNMEALFIKPTQHNGAAFTLSVLAANIAADALNPHSPGVPAQDFALVCYNCKEFVDVGLIYKDGFEN